MKIHEYQAKQIMANHGVPVPSGAVASTPREAINIVSGLGGNAVIKAQVHAGGRGKAGGINTVSSAEESFESTKALLETNLVTSQTSSEGVPVHSVLVEEMVNVERELYLAMVIDGVSEGVVAMASEAGGMEIEEVADHTPEKILRAEIDPLLGLQSFQCRKLAYGLNVKKELVSTVAELIANLYEIFVTYDCSLAEINPLVLTTDDRILAVDAKLNFDDDAMFRHPDIYRMYDPGQEDLKEAEARDYDISYVKLDGTIGCIVNGAGLAMATMDAVNAAGASAANFLDVGGGADEGKVSQALKIILSDPSVEQVLVNIFGGILRCDVVARGLLLASESMPKLTRPMVVRMLGTNAEEGRRIMSQSSLDVTLVDGLNEAAESIKSSL